MSWIWWIALPAVTALASVAGTRLALDLLLRRGLMDVPNERSSHVRPVPRGGGIAVVGATIAAWLVALAAGVVPALPTLAVMAGAALLAAVSLRDDVRSLRASVRLAIHLGAVAIGLAFALDGPVFQGWLPLWLDRVLAAFAWVWFVNLFNFMDGIDGISGVEAAAVGGGLALVLTQAGLLAHVPLALTLAAAAAGFLVWNWQPARIFLGDVGSVPLGYLLGWLLLDAAARGLWAPAVILPLYYLADATWTLLRRVARAEPFWKAHRQHFYQRGVAAGLSHARVAGAILAVNLVLVALALLAGQGWTTAAIAGAALVVLLLLAHLARAGRTGDVAGPAGPAM